MKTSQFELAGEGDADGLLRLLRVGSVKFAYVMPSNFTGDLTHVIAAVAHQRNARSDPPVAVVIVARDSTDPDKLVQQLRFVFAGDDKVTVVVVTGAGRVPFTRESGPKAVAHLLEVLKPVNARSVSDATSDSQQMFKRQAACPCWPQLEAYQQLVRQVAQLRPQGSSAELTVADIFRQTCFNFGIKMYWQTVCIWTRVSGKRKHDPAGRSVGRGGANPQYDSSHAVLAQLCEHFASTQPVQVLLIGPGTDEIRARFRERLVHENIVVAGCYWDEFKRCGATGMTREHENAFFAFLFFAWQCPIVHIGMKSGQMDSLGALWRQPTVFIHQDEAPAVINRVNKWLIPRQLEPLKLDKLPTVTGQLIRALLIQKPSLDEDDWAMVDLAKRYLLGGAEPQAQQLASYCEGLRPRPMRDAAEYARQVQARLREMRRSATPAAAAAAADDAEPEVDLDALRRLSASDLVQVTAAASACLGPQKGVVPRLPD